MKAEEITPIAIPGRNLDQRPDRKNAARHQAKAAPAAKINTDTAKSISTDRIQLINLENANSQSQQLARHIRHVDQAMQAIDSHLSEMRVKLEQIVKIYPPYPPESTERIEALRQFNALRKMIDQLTQSNQITDTQNSIDSLPLHSGAGGLDIPNISTQASDPDIADALDKTTEAQAALQARRQSFVTEANHILSQF